MYEETKIKFDWKGFLLKFAIIILVVILVIKLLPTKQKSHSESFTSNLTKLKDVSINYFQNNNSSKEIQSIIQSRKSVFKL